MFYIAKPQKTNNVLEYVLCPIYGVHSVDFSAIKRFLEVHYGKEWVDTHSETELRNRFYASGYILKFSAQNRR